jgi:hypothetical protein
MWDFVMDKSGAGAGFLRELRFVSPANLHCICFSTIIFTITRGWQNRPGVAAVPIASQTKLKKNSASMQKRPKWFTYCDFSHLAIACETFRFREKVSERQQDEKREVGEQKHMIPQTYKQHTTL